MSRRQGVRPRFDLDRGPALSLIRALSKGGMDDVAHPAPAALAPAKSADRADRHAVLQRLRNEEAGLVEALSELQADLDACMRATWLACAQRDLSGERARARCEQLLGEVERLECELRHVRTAIAGLVEQLAARAPGGAGSWRVGYRPRSAGPPSLTYIASRSL